MGLREVKQCNERGNDDLTEFPRLLGCVSMMIVLKSWNELGGRGSVEGLRQG